MKRNAFTFVEFLICVAIVALLAAILLPALDRAHKKAEKERVEAITPLTRFQVGDLVYVDGLSVTGKVNYATEYLADIIMPDGKMTLNINVKNLKKVKPQPEEP